MTEYVRRKWRRMSMLSRWSVVSALALVAGFSLLVFAADTDQDGMSDDYEDFFGLDSTNAADASLNYDADTLVNSNEFPLWTDPYATDTDQDGWHDGIDSNPVSRAFIDWGNPFFTTGDDHDYAGPDWWTTAYKMDGQWVTNPSAWYVSAGTSNNVGVLSIEVDRALLTNDAVLEVELVDSTNAFIYLDLYDTNDVVIATNLLGNLIAGSGGTTNLFLDIPLETYVEAVGIQIRRGSGEITIHESLLYVDEDGDGLDKEQEEQLGTSDNDTDSDYDGLSDYDEVFTQQTDPADPDSDDDGLSDGEEVNTHNTDPNDSDSDDDGLSDGAETATHGTDPNNSDTDGDGMPDGWEIQHGFNPAAMNVADVVGWWKLDETNGVTAVDSSTNSNDGTVSGALHVEGQLGYGLEFDGADDELSVENDSAYKPSVITLSLRTRFEGTHGNSVTGSVADGHMTLIVQENAADGSGYAFYKTERNSLVFEVENSSQTNTAAVETADGFAVTGSWYRLIGTYEGTNLVFYANGELVGAVGHGSPLEYDAGSGLLLGRPVDGGDGGWFDGVLDDALVLDVALSAESVADLDEMVGDADNDGLRNLDEYENNTDPNDSDSDDDGLSDGEEVNTHNTDPNDSDSDDDGLSDGAEVYTHGTDPNDSDSDDDGLSDYSELNTHSTDPDDSDSDDDGLADGAEVNTHATDPLDSDGDDDTLSDGDEINSHGSNPNSSDSDGDGLSDPDEVNTYGTDPASSDSDADNMSDPWEIQYGLNPTNLSGDELVGYWRLDETNGLTAADSSSAGNDGSVSGAAIVEGYIRNGRSLDGVDDSISVTNAADYKPVAPLSIAACVNLSALYGNSVTGSVDDGHMVLAAQKNAGDGHGYALYKTGRNSLVFEVANSSVTNAALIETADGFVVTGRWYYIVATYDGSNLALYADNDLVGTTQYNASLECDTEAGLVIGHGGLADDGYVAGVLDEIRVYSMALGPDQIEAIDYAAQDSDSDGFANYEESIYGTSPTNSDTDGDGLSDYDEVNTHNTDPTAADTDGDEIPDDGEIDLGLDPNDDTDAALDPDSDGLSNLEEYENGTDIDDSDSDDDGLSDGDEVNTHGTNPLSGDTDSDGLPDKWEVDNGTDPDVADASDDPDEDRLINTDEYNEGTLPLDADTDDDGVNDWVEVEHAFSDPLTADFDGSYTNVYELDGADANAALGSWGRWDTEAYSRGRRGGLGYTNILTVSQAGVHRIEVEAYGQYMYDAKLIAYVDGQYVGYNFLLLSGGATNTTHFFSPWLTNGNHSLIVFWDNVFDAPTLNITAVRVQEVGGPDGNGNGVADWIDNRFGNMCSIDSLSVTSRFSPYCMEGKARHLGMMTISGAVGPEHGAGRRWYADVPLSSGSPTNVVVSFQDGGLTSTSTVMWAEFNILGESDTAVRVGDSLLLTAVPAGATNGTVEIEIVGVTNYLTDVVSPVAHEFGGTGIFTVVGTHDNGSVSSNSLEVEVIDAAFPTNVPAAWWGKTRTVECPQVPLSGVVVEGDEDTTVGELQPRVGSGAKFSLRIGESDEQRYLAVRLGQDGPVLDSTPIAGFWVRSVIDGYYYEIAVQEDGSRVIQDTLVMGYLPESVTINMNIVVGSATFDDGTILRTLAVDDLSDVGEYVYRMIVPSGQTAPCHYVSAHQGGVNIGQ